MADVYTLEQAKQFVKDNIVIRWYPENPELQKLWDDMLQHIPCMDGRGITRRHQDNNMPLHEKIQKMWFSIPGGAVGLVIVLYGMMNKLFSTDNHDIDHRKIDSMISVLIAKYGGKLKYHTDHHHPDDCLWCGFLKNAFHRASDDKEINKFGLNNKNIDSIYWLMETYPDKSAVLQWDHLEKAVLLLMPPSKNYKLFGMWHTDEDTGDQCFVIDIRMAKFATKKMIWDLSEIIQLLNLHEHIDYDSDFYKKIYREHGLVYSRSEYTKDPSKYLDAILSHLFLDQLNNNIIEIYKILAPQHPIYHVHLDSDDTPLVIPHHIDIPGFSSFSTPDQLSVYRVD